MNVGPILRHRWYFRKEPVRLHRRRHHEDDEQNQQHIDQRSNIDHWSNSSALAFTHLHSSSTNSGKRVSLRHLINENVPAYLVDQHGQLERPAASKPASAT